jgi:hypothetical protein
MYQQFSQKTAKKIRLNETEFSKEFQPFTDRTFYSALRVLVMMVVVEFVFESRLEPPWN